MKLNLESFIELERIITKENQFLKMKKQIGFKVMCNSLEENLSCLQHGK